MIALQALKFEGGSQPIAFNKTPDNCPFCHNKITPRQYQGFVKQNLLKITFRCPDDSCGRTFLSFYERNQNGHYYYSTSSVGNFQERNFSENIKDLSSNFIEIYNQTSEAENLDLNHLSGIGYRKALEFLIKDYLISKIPNDESKENDKKRDAIKKKFLGKCIDEDIDNVNLKSMAKRATWLGNDETHYVRKWENKDVQDLKKLIELSLHWIEMELLTEHYNSEMN